MPALSAPARPIRCGAPAHAIPLPRLPEALCGSDGDCAEGRWKKEEDVFRAGREAGRRSVPSAKEVAAVGAGGARAPGGLNPATAGVPKPEAGNGKLPSVPERDPRCGGQRPRRLIPSRRPRQFHRVSAPPRQCAGCASAGPTVGTTPAGQANLAYQQLLPSCRPNRASICSRRAAALRRKTRGSDSRCA